jgi:hypothetical protein
MLQICLLDLMFFFYAKEKSFQISGFYADGTKSRLP